ncbi:uncharacterized protein BJ212DRAFT_1349386 [Suillus subaureus]|uniref:Uncharacterized protein n=1 Tax=Suillus subaureus TaxID=48587 RepID=A0A9P7ED54_9AGAM|nr:uncharacterized protein BJ212DRAFT_1349386 [Suillus subaureus]KAG1818190.1 hypothetical protein BJ212DRAFT_1349386 [Suillus subaureus]
MTHNCINWDAIPLRFLMISYANKKMLTRKGPASKVREFKSLQSFAHRKFAIGDRPPSSLRFRTTCNLSSMPCKDDSAFEVDEEAWEEEGLMDLVCCLEVYLEEVIPGPSGEETLQLVEEEHEDARTHKQARDSDEQENRGGEHSDIAEVNKNVEEVEAQDEDEAEKGQDKEEQEEEEEEQEEDEQTEEREESTVWTRPFGRRRRVIVSDEEDGPKALDRSSRLAADLQQIQKAPVVGDPQPLAPSAQNRTIAGRTQNMPHVPDIEQPIKKENETPPAYRVRVSSVAGSSQEGRSLFGVHEPPGRPIKQEQNSSSAERTVFQPQAIQESPELAHTKLVISIQHKPSAQHAQFSTKPHTRMGKVLTGACKSFRLDVNVAQLYLVVVTQSDQGLKEEDYFLCDRNETVEAAVVGVEGRAEFMIRMPEDPAT